jgi:hypothetical protein
LKAERASRLKILQSKIGECVDEGEGKLKNLLQQIELYSDFMAGRNAHLEAQAASDAANKRARRKEKEEDDDLLKGRCSLPSSLGTYLFLPQENNVTKYLRLCVLPQARFL